MRNQLESVRALGVPIEVFAIKSHLGRSEYFKAPRDLYRLMRRESFDLIHAQHTYPLYMVWVIRELLRLDTPIVLTFRESEFMRPEGFRMDKKGVWAKLITSRRLKRKAISLADHIIAVWSGLMTGLGYDGPYEEMASGVDLEKFRPIPRAEARMALGWEPDEKVLFFPADRRRRTEKGADLLDTAVALLRDKGLDVRVEYAIDLPHERMPYYMAAADAVVHPTRFDASPNVVKEAMAVGTPIVTTVVGDVRKVSEGLESVLWTEPDPGDIAEKIEIALGLPQSLEGRTRLEQLGLSEASVARRLERLYREWSK
ncbi:MAG: glycosyltransferase family 4 protein [Candidatus Eisenbacteria bacterium]